MEQLECLDVTIPYLSWYFPSARPLLEEALKRGDGGHSIKTIEKELHSGDLVLTLLYTKDDSLIAACVCEIYPTSTGERLLDAILVAGEPHCMDDWLPTMVDHLVKAGESAGCSRLVAAGRKGWQKILNQHKFETIGVMYSRKLA